MEQININIYYNNNFYNNDEINNNNISRINNSQIYSPSSGNSGTSGNSVQQVSPFDDKHRNSGAYFTNEKNFPKASNNNDYSSINYPYRQAILDKSDIFTHDARDLIKKINRPGPTSAAEGSSPIWKENKEYQAGDRVVAGNGRTYVALRSTMGEGPWSSAEAGYGANNPAWKVDL
ncbi:hypothetical protein [Dyella nitratireducens]|uniref:Carbohydrate binding domain-containing protein n=1 Tax=Dyella nitratireducens TaxID=1849580 RepID=A0ABQ1FQ27_9GAMM|nr:hypothetical protein [Dyella nitratireducens]GGA23350.1 hypothetical protein GCM10010981_09590 [Dyella nitratireducens]GLQ43978.1 hypothetical protein GCM10007902_38280 [Dyella nitratireducens]